MKHSSILKEVSKLGLEITSKPHSWTINNVTYSETRHEARQGSVTIDWTERVDGSSTCPMIADASDPSDPRCDYMGKVSHIYKVKNIIPTFNFFINTQGNSTAKLVGNLLGYANGGAK